MTAENVKKVILEVLPESRLTLWRHWIPPGRIDTIIGKQSYSPGVHDEQLIEYIIKYSPYAVWSKIAQQLYEKGEKRALETAKQFFMVQPGDINKGQVYY